MHIRPYQPKDLPQLTDIYNQSVQAKEVVYPPLTLDAFQALYINNPHGTPEFFLTALQNDMPVGFILGTLLQVFLPGQDEQNTPGFLTALYVDKAFRRKGIGAALLSALCQRMAAACKSRIAISGDNPIKQGWLIPSAPGHDHNNAPGVDTLCPGYSFLLKQGFTDHHREVAMYLPLSCYQPLPDMAQRQQRLLDMGITTGRYDPRLQHEFDAMCDRIPSEYWRKVLQDETASPHPRTILAATVPGHIVAFTGPVDKQPSGRGWFTGICTDPLYEKKGIATVLFNLLMEEFIAIGATFSTLFTGSTNHARKIYERAGFQVAREFAVMEKTL